MDHALQTGPRAPSHRTDPPAPADAPADTAAAPAPPVAADVDYLSFYLPDGAHV